MFNILRTVHNNATDAQRLSRFDSIGQIAAGIVNVMFAAAFAISIISIAMALIQYAFSQGDPKRLETSWRAFFWAVVSGLIALAAFGIRMAIINAYGVTAPEITNGTPGF